MKRAQLLVVLWLFVLTSFAQQSSPSPASTQVFGFRDFTRQHQWDQKFIPVPSPALAEEHLNRAVALGGDEVKDAHRFLGAIYLQRGDRERGVAELETYLKLAPKAKDAEAVRQVVRQNKH